MGLIERVSEGALRTRLIAIVPAVPPHLPEGHPVRAAKPRPAGARRPGRCAAQHLRSGQVCGAGVCEPPSGVRFHAGLDMGGDVGRTVAISSSMPDGAALPAL
jgi:hypothetical protein